MDTQEPENVIVRYTEAQALEDGVLAAIDALPVNLVTRAVFDHFTRPMEGSPATDGTVDIRPLRRAIATILAIEADADGWRVGVHEGKSLWLVPNDICGTTLMFPEDW